MNTSTEFQTLSAHNLSTIIGGQGPTIPQPGPVNQNDFAGKYVNNLKQDAKDWWAREGATANDLRAHRWGSAALNFGGALLNEVGFIGDAIAPIKALK